MTVSLEVLKKAAQELNESIQPDPPIKINTKSTINQLTSEIKEVVEECMQDGDEVTQETVDLLMELEIDVPGKVKIKKAIKQKEEKKTESKKDKKEKIKENKSESKNNQIEYVSGLIEKKQYTRKQIVEMYLKKFPESTKKKIVDTLSYGKNPKYNKFKKLIKENKEGVLYF